MQSIGTGKHACKSFSLLGLWSNPTSLAGYPRLIAWGRLLCAEAGHAHATAGDVALAVETWVCFSLHQQASWHRLLALLLNQQ